MADENTPNTNQTTEENQAPIIKDPEKVLKTLEAVRKENDEYRKQLQEIKQTQIDSQEYERLKVLEEEVKKSQKRAEEEKLKQENNWEELTARKLAEQEAKYTTQIETLNNNISSLQSELSKESQAKQNLDNLVDEYTRRQTAFDQYILNGGKREYFENVWKGELRDRTSLGEDKKVKIAKAPGTDDFERDETGEPLSMSDWMVKYRSNGGGIFFNPTNNAAGSGVSPANNNTPSQANKTIYISRKEAGSQKFMSELKTRLDGKDPLTAISEGIVVVQ